MSARGKRVAAPAETLDIALSLARYGWPVFPVTIYEDASGKRSKVPAVPKGTSWKDWATTDEAKIRGEWPRGCWIGVYAGAAGIVTLDVDPGGDESIAEAGHPVPVTFNYPTHRKGGRHYVYAAPEGVDLTIAKGLLKGVDVRSGAGLMVYYGPELDEPPTLAPAPDWILVQKGESRSDNGSSTDRAPSGDEDALRERLVDGKPSADVRAVMKKVTRTGMGHDDMLAVVTELVGLGVKGRPGVGAALDEARQIYAEGWPDAGRHWDNALQGSIRRLGLPPATLALTKTERREIKKRNKPDRTKGGSVKGVNPIIAVNDDSELALVTSEDLRDRLAFVAGGWREFDGRIWEDVSGPRVDEIVRAHHHELAQEMFSRNPKLAEWLVRKATIQGSAQLIRGRLIRRAEDFDAHPDLVNVLNGVLDLRTGELRPHDSALLLTNLAGAKYRPGARHDDWDAALKALPRDRREHLKRRAGQALTGYQPDDQALAILKGGGANGKSTIMNAVKSAFGTYARVAPEKLLLPSRGDHSTELASIAGARLVLVEELPEGRHINAKRVKDLAGTGTLTARQLYRDNFQFEPVHAVWISTNYTPQLSETDDGTWRRFELVEFPRKYVDDPVAAHERPKDRGLVGRLLSGRGGRAEAVLAWLVEGAREWYDNGQQIPAPPESVARAKAEWRSQTDLVMAFATERLEFDAARSTTTKAMADAFTSWLFNNGHPSWSHQTITARLESHDLFARNRVRLDRPYVDGKRVRAWSGVGLKPNDAVLDSLVTPSQHHTN